MTVRVKKAQKKAHITIGTEDSSTPLDQSDSSFEPQKSVIPGTQNVYVKTWGCTHNSSDSEYMAGLLAAYGYNIISNYVCHICRYVVVFLILPADLVGKNN